MNLEQWQDVPIGTVKNGWRLKEVSYMHGRVCEAIAEYVGKT